MGTQSFVRLFLSLRVVCFKIPHNRNLGHYFVVLTLQAHKSYLIYVLLPFKLHGYKSLICDLRDISKFP